MRLTAAPQPAAPQPAAPQPALEEPNLTYWQKKLASIQSVIDEVERSLTADNLAIDRAEDAMVDVTIDVNYCLSRAEMLGASIAEALQDCQGFDDVEFRRKAVAGLTDLAEQLERTKGRINETHDWMEGHGLWRENDDEVW